MKISKKILALLTTVLLIAASVVPVAAADNGDVLYEYNAATAKNEWKSFTGNWTYDENGISVKNDGNDVWYYSYIGVDEGWTDYVIEADLVGVGSGGIIFRSTKPEKGIDTFGGYYIGYDSAYAFAGMDYNNMWKLLPDDGPDAPAAAPLPYSAKMHWKIVVEGNTYTLYVDNGPVPFVQMQDSTYTSGGIGVRFSVNSGDDSGYFSNVKVSKLPAKTKTPTETQKPDVPPGQTVIGAPEDNSSETPAESSATEQVPSEASSELEAPAASLMWLWIVIAAVVVAAVAVVIIVIVAKRKKA